MGSKLTISEVIVLVILASAGKASADPQSEASDHVERATKFHGEGRFAEALDELKTAYALAPQPDLLFAIGQVYVKLGKCPEAISFYQRFLASNPKASPAAAARQAIQVCTDHPPDAVPEPKPESKPEPKPEPAKVEPKVAPVAAPPKLHWVSQPFYTDKLGDALVVGGAISGVVASVMYSGALGNAHSADSATGYQQHLDLEDQAHSKRTIAVIFGAAGAALMGGGIVRYLTGDRRVETAEVAIVPTTNGGLVTWAGWF